MYTCLNVNTHGIELNDTKWFHQYSMSYAPVTCWLQNTKEQWQTVFFIAATFLGFGGLCFTVCGSGELQRWAYCDDIDLATEYSSEISDSYSEPSPDDDQDLAFESAEESPPRAKPDQPPRRHRRRSSARRSASDRKHSHNHIEDMSNGTTPQTPVEDRKPSAASHHSRKRSLPRSVDLELQRTSHSEEPRYGIEGLSESIVWLISACNWHPHKWWNI